jgi:hypothetical protein
MWIDPVCYYLLLRLLCENFLCKNVPKSNPASPASSTNRKLSIVISFYLSFDIYKLVPGFELYTTSFISINTTKTFRARLFLTLAQSYRYTTKEPTPNRDVYTL